MAVAASLGWGSLLMSFHAGNVIFLPQCPVIGSAAGTGRGLPARHRSLPGVPQDPGGRNTPVHPQTWQETTALDTEMLPRRKRSEMSWGHPAPRGETKAPQGWGWPWPGFGAVRGCRAPSVGAGPMVRAGRGWLCPTTARSRRAASSPGPGTVTATAPVTPRCCSTGGALPKCCWHLLAPVPASVLESSLAPGIPANSRCQHRTGVR